MSDSSDDKMLITLEDKPSPVNRHASNSIPDVVRDELLWERSEEDLLNVWKKEAMLRRRGHSVTGGRKKRFHKVFGTLSVVVPIIFTGLSQSEINTGWINTLGFCLTGIISGLLAFYGFDGLTERHFEYESKYDDYVQQIESELCKPRKNRVACDVFLKEMQLKLGTLNAGAPDL